MKQYEEVFFTVLRTALWGHPLDIPEGFKDWGKVMKLAKTQALTGLVGDVMKTTPAVFESLPAQGAARLQEIPLDQMAKYATSNNALVLVVSTLRKNGVESVLLKGQGVGRNYPVPALREYGDIDLYVGEENYAKAYDILLPVVTEIDDRKELESQTKHFHAKVGPVAVEIHRFASVFDRPKMNKAFQKYARKGLTENLVPMEVAGQVVNTPADDFNVYYIFNHLLHHFYTSGVGLRQVCDLMCLLHERNGKYDETVLKEILTEMGEMEAWQVFGCLMVDELGLPESDFPFYNPKKRDKAHMMLKRILVEGNFGHNRPYIVNPEWGYFRRKYQSLKYNLTRISGVARIFPEAMFYRFFYMFKRGFEVVWKDLKAR